MTLDLVFPSQHGKCFYFKDINRCQLHPTLKRLRLPRIRFHDLRHTFATMLIGKGVNIKVVSEILGHANVSITLRSYAHVLPHMQDSAAQVIDSIFTNLSTEN